MSKRLTIEEFIERAKNVHGDKYDYSLVVKYETARTHIPVICKNHGQFMITPNHHVNRKQGCPGCKKLGLDGFLERAISIHGNKYGYSLVEYKNNKSKVKIICPTHGVFEQRVNDHLSGACKCPECINDSLRKNVDDFKFEASKTHSNKYDYSLIHFIKNNKQKISIICPTHGEFQQQSLCHLQGQGCPVCKESRGEKEIRDILKENAIIFENQKKFDDCRNINPLPFDFYLPEYNICIEYNGRQHYQTVSNNFFGDEEQLMQTQKRDKIKYHYCKNNDIKLVVIKYDENISEKVNELLTTLKVVPQ